MFLVTGIIMRVYFPDKEAISVDLRLLMRSRHIYILFNSVAHLLIGIYGASAEAGWRRMLQNAGSVLLILASALAVTAFFTEVFDFREFSVLSALGVQATFVGALLHVLGGWKRE